MKLNVKIAGIFAVVAFALTVVSADAAFTRDLTLGSTGTDVSELQTVLEQGGYLTMPAGVAKGYFGQLTKSAVAKWQAAVGLPSTGYFGPMSRAKLAETPSTPSTPGSTSDLKGGDGDFKGFKQITSVDSENLDEGDSQQVLGFKFEADDSDLMIERVNATFSTTTGEKPWKYFDEVALYNGDEKVADVDASDKDNWDEGDADEYEISFTGLKEVVEEGDEAEFFIEVTSKDSIDDTDLPITWKVELFNQDVRALNAEGINVYSDDAFVATFDQDVADSSDLKITYKASENEDQSIEVDDKTDTTDDVLLYTFKIEAQDGDVNIDEVTVDVSTTTGTVDTVEEFVKNIKLVIDGDEVGSESGDTSVLFEDIDFDLSEDDEVEVEVYADIEGTDDGDQFTSGAGVYVATVTIDYIDSQDDDKSEDVQSDGGDVTFYTQGITADFESQTATVEYGQYSGDNDRGTFSITFKVTAFGDEDIYIGGANSTGSSNAGISYTISSSTAASITKAELTSNAEEGDEDTFIVSAGDTETFTFTVEIQDASTTAADVAQKLTLTGIKWDIDDDSTPDSTYDDNLDDFKTASKTI
jgi:peptidoglycan hydrolase-like protein with peptidoglycan-binding domain